MTSSLSAIESLARPSDRMPVFFIGHGDPMNALRDNAFTQSLARMGKSVAVQPRVILVVSAHWLTRGGTFVTTTPKPETIYDFYGFPQSLYQVTYPAPGAPEVAREIERMVPEVQANSEWGLDHGAWSVLRHMYPDASIPVFQMSIDYYQPMQYHFDLAKQLRSLRDKGVLVIGSGNIVHNLRLWFQARDGKPFDWAVEFDEWVRSRIDDRDFKSLLHYESLGQTAKLSVPTVDHYVPMLYSLALADPSEPITYTYEEIIGAGSMRCFRIG